MSRRLSRSLVVSPVLVALLFSPANAAGPSADESPVILQRFLSLDDPTPIHYRALRHLEAHNDRFEMSAWMDVWTEADASGFRYVIAAEDGSDYLRTKVFRASLETERTIWASGAPNRAGLTPANYTFEERGVQPDGLSSLRLKPRRKDVLLVDGSIFLNPDDGDLVRMEGRLSKAPSFWFRRVEITRHFQRFCGYRMATLLEATATILFAGPSSLRATYEYESIDGRRLGNPQPRTVVPSAAR
jgi:hypothetical protein